MGKEFGSHSPQEPQNPLLGEPSRQQAPDEYDVILPPGRDRYSYADLQEIFRNLRNLGINIDTGADERRAVRQALRDASMGDLPREELRARLLRLVPESELGRIAEQWPKEVIEGEIVDKNSSVPEKKSQPELNSKKPSKDPSAPLIILGYETIRDGLGGALDTVAAKVSEFKGSAKQRRYERGVREEDRNITNLRNRTKSLEKTFSDEEIKSYCQEQGLIEPKRGSHKWEALLLAMAAEENRLQVGAGEIKGGQDKAVGTAIALRSERDLLRAKAQGYPEVNRQASIANREEEEYFRKKARTWGSKITGTPVSLAGGAVEGVATAGGELISTSVAKKVEYAFPITTGTVVALLNAVEMLKIGIVSADRIRTLLFTSGLTAAGTFVLVFTAVGILNHIHEARKQTEEQESAKTLQARAR